MKIHSRNAIHIRHKSVTSLKQKFDICSAPKLVAIQCFTWNEEACKLKHQKTSGSAKRMMKWVGHVAQAMKIRKKCEIIRKPSRQDTTSGTKA